MEQVLASLTPRQKVQQLLIVGFQGPRIEPDVQQFIAENKVGGVFLSRETCNIINGTDHDPEFCHFPDDVDPDTPAQVTALTQQLQQASCDATSSNVAAGSFCLPLLVTIDHEGDDRPTTRLLNRFTPIPSNMAIGATFDPKQAEEVGCIVGQELSAVGVNVLLGPDLDVLDSPRSGGPGDQGIRSFGGDPLWVAEMGSAYVRGVQECSEGRLATIVKHFPGHGRSTRRVEYEDVPVVVGKTLEMLAAVDLTPFSAVAQGAPGDVGVADGIMNSHLSYPEVPGCDAGTPVAFSPSCMQAFFGLSTFTQWRQGGGVTMADDLAVGAVTAYAQRKFGTYQQADVALEALMAGNDLLPLIRPWQWEDLGFTVDYLVARYEADTNVRERVDDAVRRVLTLKHRLYGGLDPAKITAALDPTERVGQAENAAKVAAIAEKSLTLIQPGSPEALPGSIPVPSLNERILFVECWGDPRCAPPNPDEADLYPPVWPRGTLASLTLEMFSGRVLPENLDTIGFSELGEVLDGAGDEQVERAAQDADWLVFAFLERDPTYFPASEVLKDFLGRGSTLLDLRTKKVVVFAYNSPYHLDAGELRNVDLFIALYSKIEPSLRASLKALFQDPTLFRDGGGSLPVDYAYNDFVLYDLSEQVQADPSQTLNLVFDPSLPIAGQQFQVSLAEPLIAMNGHRVPNGTNVTFSLDLPDGTTLELAATTVEGLTTASLAVDQAGEMPVRVQSGRLNWTAPEPLVVSGPKANPDETLSDDGGGSAGVWTLIGGIVAGGAMLAAVGFGYFRLRMRRPLPATDSGPMLDAALPPDAGAAAPSLPVPVPDLRIDVGTHRIFVKGQELAPPLSREQFALISYLHENNGRLCTRDEIIRRAWPEAEIAGVSDEAVDALVHRVRDRLRAAGLERNPITTVRGQGFRLDL